MLETLSGKKVHCYSSFQVLIFDRPIKDCPLFFEATSHNPPVVSFGSRGTKDKGFVQPCNVAVSTKGGGHVYVVDTGNSRIKVRRVP